MVHNWLCGDCEEHRRVEAIREGANKRRRAQVAVIHEPKVDETREMARPPLPAAPHDIPAPRGLLEGVGATPPDAPEGIDPADAAALRGGDTAVPPPSAPLPSSNEVCSSQQPAATAAEARTLPPRHQLPTCTLWLPVRVPTALPPSHSHIAPPRPLAFVCVCRWRPCYAAASACATALRRCTPTWVRSPRATARTHGACYTRLRGVRPRSCCPQTLQDRRRCPRRLRAIRR